ncbi:TPA: hypothetical protein QDC22_007508 [Burkholderia stabilis]|nr:hypothetical protein [Burkholderia stabilis]HDR9589119.1 hypothetical protein [Burkholderia stabilis]HDR9649515.1 hypothetical protein [Burkholderia stabilis]HDR9653581.1 hypothetical protein [Burkholderia stabilis]HDR9656276.1 hypothetical protein [Burkholderia stabilis]
MLTDYRAIHSPAYFGRGTVHVGPPLRGDGSVGALGWSQRAAGSSLQLPPGRPIGNVRRLDVQPQLTRLNVSPWDEGENTIVDGVTLALELYGHGGANLAMALGSAHTQAVGARRVDVVHVDRATMPAGSMLFTRHLVDVHFDVACRPSWTTWTEGEHWIRTEHGPQILVGCSGPSGGSIQMSYTSAGGAEDVSGNYRIGEMSLVYAGINRYDRSAERLDCYRASIASVDGMPLISESIGVVTLSINLLPVRFGRGDVRWYRRVSGAHMAGAYAK